MLTDQPMPLPANFPSFFDQPTGPNPAYFVDAAYANDLCKHHSTTGYAVMPASGAIAWHSKTQSFTALSSTEAGFYTTVSTAKVCLFICHVINCLGYHPTGPTTIY